MLVEDDNNLREIYEARLLAEGYEIVSAHDGEEALALAVKEKPDLIISDVMMPKISGFDMLDILRSTPETKDTKVIMMTALSQAEDKERADKLGADRYLVKSQVTLEDVAKIAREVLEGTGAAGAAASPPPMPDPVAAPVTNPMPPVTPDPVASPVVAAPVAAPPADPAPVMPDPIPAPAPTVSPAPDASAPVTSTLDSVETAQTATDEQSVVNNQVKEFVAQTPGTDVTPAPSEASLSDNSASVNGKKTLQPIGDPTAKPDLNRLLEDEERKNPTTSTVVTPQNPGEDPNLISL